jgi:CDP-diacylglycerol--serine O-phosphatidyltransferase
MRRKAFFLPSAITAFGLSCGLFAIFRASLIPQGAVTEAILITLAGILLLAAIADILDGAVARAMKIESEFGGLFDSLADAVSFGVAPSLIIVKSISATPDGEFPLILMGAAMIYTVCGILRLVRFNVQLNATQNDEEASMAYKKHFTGLPIPAAAAAAIAWNLLIHSADLKTLITLSETAKLWSLVFQLIVLGYLMVSRFKFPSIKTLRFPVGTFQVVFFTVVIALLILYGMLSHFALVLFIFSWGYIFLSLTLAVIRLIVGKKNNTLEDFEPDDSDDFLH